MSNNTPRDKQFTGYANALHKELVAIHYEGYTNNWNSVDIDRKVIQAIARRTHDLAWFIVKQTYRGENGPGEILYLDGEPVKMQPDNLAEWFKRAPFLASYDGLPNEVKAWVEQDLGWKRDEIIGFHIENEVLYHGIDDKGNKQHTQGKHVSVTVERDTREKHVAWFLRSNGQWQKEEDHNVTPLPGMREVTE